jgi:hypothetical protein
VRDDECTISWCTNGVTADQRVIARRSAAVTPYARLTLRTGRGNGAGQVSVANDPAKSVTPIDCRARGECSIACAVIAAK